MYIYHQGYGIKRIDSEKILCFFFFCEHVLLRINPFLFFYRNLVDGGVTNPGLYDQPRPQFYDVPKASLPSSSPFRSSTSSIGSNMEVKNPVYLEKKK